MCAGPSCCTAPVLINGFASPFFPLKGGLAQGSGASPLYWTVVLQPFTAYVNSLAAPAAPSQ